MLAAGGGSESGSGLQERHLGWPEPEHREIFNSRAVECRAHSRTGRAVLPGRAELGRSQGSQAHPAVSSCSPDTAQECFHLNASDNPAKGKWEWVGRWPFK